MPKHASTFMLAGLDDRHQIRFSQFHYQGHGVYQCTLSIKSNGFACEKTFDFDNDEYFLAKLKDVLVSKSGYAELMDLQNDDFLKIQSYETERLLVTGLILEEQPLTQSFEFAFLTTYAFVERFVGDFARVVRVDS